MMHKFIVVCCLIFLSPLYGQTAWELTKEKDDIQVFTRTNQVMSFKEFKATMVMEGNVEDFISVLFDVEGLTSWGHNVTEAELLERPHDTIQIYYAVAKAPWPYKNRDGIYKNIFNWDAGGKELTVDIEMLDDGRLIENNFVRMDGYGSWKVKVMPNDKLKVEFQMQVDPGGSIKAWLANMFVTDSPFYTMTGMQSAMRLEKYQDKSYVFLED